MPLGVPPRPDARPGRPAALAPAALSCALALLAVPVAAAADDSFRCDGGIVSVGDSKLDLLGKCGEPALRDGWQEERSSLGPWGAGASVAQAVEQWTYNFGPQRFLRVVTLRAGKVVRIHQGGYGYTLPDSPRPRSARATCDASALHLGDTKLDLLARCGEPASRDVRQELRWETVPGPQGTMTVSVTVDVEVWTFDLGPQQFVRVVTIEDGRVVAIESGSYGYAR